LFTPSSSLIVLFTILDKVISSKKKFSFKAKFTKPGLGVAFVELALDKVIDAAKQLD
jgi:hypothetical protein